MPTYELAQINVARFLLPKEHTHNADFMAALDQVNAQADAAPGFVWRLVGEGNNATDIEAVAGDPLLLVNMSVWQDVDALAAFVYRQTDHRTVMRQRKRWFERMDPFMALWWVPAGRRPSVAEGMAKLEQLAAEGPTPAAFTFVQPFAAPDGMPAAPVLDECA